jgi:hypothetical protein
MFFKKVCPMGCKSGCGGALSSYSHCKQSIFSDEELQMFPELKKTKVNSQNKTTKLCIGYK